MLGTLYEQSSGGGAFVLPTLRYKIKNKNTESTARHRVNSILMYAYITYEGF